MKEIRMSFFKLLPLIVAVEFQPVGVVQSKSRLDRDMSLLESTIGRVFDYDWEHIRSDKDSRLSTTMPEDHFTLDRGSTETGRHWLFTHRTGGLSPSGLIDHLLTTETGQYKIDCLIFRQLAQYVYFRRSLPGTEAEQNRAFDQYFDPAVNPIRVGFGDFQAGKHPELVWHDIWRPRDPQDKSPEQEGDVGYFPNTPFMVVRDSHSADAGYHYMRRSQGMFLFSKKIFIRDEEAVKFMVGLYNQTPKKQPSQHAIDHVLKGKRDILTAVDANQIRDGIVPNQLTIIEDRVWDEGTDTEQTHYFKPTSQTQLSKLAVAAIAQGGPYQKTRNILELLSDAHVSEWLEPIPSTVPMPQFLYEDDQSAGREGRPESVTLTFDFNSSGPAAARWEGFIKSFISQGEFSWMSVETKQPEAIVRLKITGLV